MFTYLSNDICLSKLSKNFRIQGTLAISSAKKYKNLRLINHIPFFPGYFRNKLLGTQRNAIFEEADGK